MKPILGVLMALCAAPALAGPLYQSADFSGGLSSVTSTMRSHLASAGYDASLFNCATCFNATPVGGHLIYDASIPILPSTGFTNIFSIGPIDGVPHSEILEVNIGPLQFHFGDPGVVGGPAIQYRDGVYNGLFFAVDFRSPNATALRLNLQGSTFSLRRLTDGATLFNGSLHVGASGLTNIQDFPPAAAIPEPHTTALLVAGLALLGFAVQRRRGAGRC